ncbi:RNA polymerase I, II and III 24.3 kDa subunit (nucleomorph) [Cryptomonas paramecium]|uniref:RNA polymerase I, II and III 24.3 kDa subunit n=1 Tax=Cryptomonas paramaecium TaxID=2898 RepID=F2HI31_9CRYP|nr:RNA polymerase I, II and III 24.3 kDa subunit [Cryptomonas paramecium]AEA38977.1 RNA polymerase I, II and III 24.3 kDa subunit [Cryptomonas paramecium]|mmetsp:Transcript_16020/g.43340  ORF Transcript_16020/g.43340 Transcript_16020/m.43340 type:complete len:217 (-) Transcript_16020:536-1186(-)
MDKENNEVFNLFRIRRTVLQLLKDRNYLVFNSKDDLNMSRIDFEFKYVKNYKVVREKMEIKRPLWNSLDKKILVVFIEKEKSGTMIGVKLIRKYCERMKQDQLSNLVIVLHAKLTSHAKQAIDTINSSGDKIEYFNESELIINITHHTLVPKHEILSLEESKCLFKRYYIKETQLPKIQKKDPISRYFGIQKNQIVRIIRPSENSGRYITYRRCII